MTTSARPELRATSSQRRYGLGAGSGTTISVMRRPLRGLDRERFAFPKTRTPCAQRGNRWGSPESPSSRLRRLAPPAGEPGFPRFPPPRALRPSLRSEPRPLGNRASCCVAPDGEVDHPLLTHRCAWVDANEPPPADDSDVGAQAHQLRQVR